VISTLRNRASGIGEKVGRFLIVNFNRLSAERVAELLEDEDVAS
jgi:hypothetical protein